MSVTPELSRLSQEDCLEVEAILVCTPRPSLKIKQEGEKGKERARDRKTIFFLIFDYSGTYK